MKLLTITAACVATLLLAPNPLAAALVFACASDNDVYRAVAKGDPATLRFDTPPEAIERAEDGAGVLILADEYPQARTEVSAELLDRARAKGLRLYVEYPASLPGVKLGEPRVAEWERGVVASDAFGESLPHLRIVALHACHFLLIEGDVKSDLVLGRVAGYDTAVYGFADPSFPLLFSPKEDDRTLIAATKLSHFMTARYAPIAEWSTIWRSILRRLDPQRDDLELEFDPPVRPALGPDDPAPPDLERRTFDRAARFYHRAGLLISKQRQAEIHRLLSAGIETVAMPGAKPADEADGSLGMLEGFAAHLRHDGQPLQRTPIRADCNAEAAMVLALDAALNPDHARSRTVASNLLDYVFGPEMQSMGRLDRDHPAFGLIAWGAISPAWQIANYGDDNARVILATITASAALESNRWDEHVARGLLANLRTTGRKGFRGDRIDVPQLEQHGWRHFRDSEIVNPAPHFEAYLWTCYLWAYARTGERAFLDDTLNAIRVTMDAYANGGWRWNNNIERARMLLCLAWLVRLDDTPEHRAWLTTIAKDLLEAQQPCGAIQERLRGIGGGHFFIPQSNEAYGVGETPLIQQPGDPASDQLYTTGFALLALREAAAATGDDNLRAAEDTLADFLCRIQIRSEQLPHVDGGWFRAFDYARWDYWASSADLGWGAWSIEAGWGQAWIAATLALRERQTSLWELTATSRVKAHVDVDGWLR